MIVSENFALTGSLIERLNFTGAAVSFHLFPIKASPRPFKSFTWPTHMTDGHIQRPSPAISLLFVLGSFRSASVSVFKNSARVCDLLARAYLSLFCLICLIAVQLQCFVQLNCYYKTFGLAFHLALLICVMVSF